MTRKDNVYHLLFSKGRCLKFVQEHICSFEKYISLEGLTYWFALFFIYDFNTQHFQVIFPWSLLLILHFVV